MRKILLIFIFSSIIVIGYSQPRALSTMNIVGNIATGDRVYPTELIYDGSFRSFGTLSNVINSTCYSYYGSGGPYYQMNFNSSGSCTSGQGLGPNYIVVDAASNGTIGKVLEMSGGSIFSPYSISNVTGLAIDIDNSGNTYIAGNGTNAGIGSHGYFVATYGATNSLTNIINLPAISSLDLLKADGSGNIIVSGNFSGTAAFSASQSITAQTGSDRFLAKYSSSGALIWAFSLQDNSTSSVFGATGITTDVNGNIILTGTISSGGWVGFDPSQGSVHLNSSGTTDFALVKYTANGSYVFAFNIGANGSTLSGGEVKTDLAGNIYCVGGYTGTVDFDPDPVKQNMMTAYFEDNSPPRYTQANSSPTNNNFIAKFKPDGLFQWVSSIRGGGYIDRFGAGVNLQIDANQNLIFQAQTFYKDIEGNIYQPYIAYWSCATIVKLDQPLLVTSFSVPKGPVGTTVIINGTNFSTTASDNAVYFNGVQATITANTSSTLTVTVPAGATTGKVSVTTAGVTATSSANFTVSVPTITSPSSGTYGTTITLTTDTGGSTGAVTYTVTNGTGSASVAGNTLSLTGAGTVSVTASFLGDANYGPGSTQPQTITINKANQTITFPSITNMCIGSASMLTATVSSPAPTPSSGLPITYTSSDVTKATITVVNGISYLNSIAAGSVTVTASQGGNANYNAVATNVSKTLTISARPVVSLPKTSLCIGASMTLSPTYNGTWLTSDPTIATVTNAGVVTGVAPGNACFTYIYTPTGCSSTTPPIVVNPGTAITVQPSLSPQTACLNGTLSPLSVTATGAGPFTYQWYFNLTNSYTGSTSISGTNSPSYTPPSSASGIRYYYVIVSGPCGSGTSAISGPITINPATTISSQVTPGQTLCLNSIASAMSVTAAGTGPFTYQWYSSDGVAVSGATSSSFVPPTTAVGNKAYYAVVTGGCGTSVTSATSGPIIVNSPTVTITSSNSLNVCTSPYNTTLTANANGATAYHWTSSNGDYTGGAQSLTVYDAETFTVNVDIAGCGTKSAAKTTTCSTGTGGGVKLSIETNNPNSNKEK